MKDWNVVELLRHSRHDWLNQIQLIKGNLTLNNIDRVHEIIDQIVIQSRHESKLSNIGVAELACQFLTFNWEPHSFLLEFEVIGEDYGDLSFYDPLLVSWWNEFVRMLDDATTKGTNNHLIVTFQNLKKEIRITFDYHGQLSNPGKIEEVLKSNEILNDGLRMLESYSYDNELVITLAIHV